MNILVTGASGLIGKGVSLYLLEQGHCITGLVNNSLATITHKNYTEVKIDLLNTELKTNTLYYDAVIHCAAALPSKYNFDEGKIVELGQKIDQNVFNYCLKNNFRIIHLSAAYLYQDREFLDENVPLRQDLKGYYLSKKKSEDFLLENSSKHVIFRISSPYGDLEKQTNVMRIFADKIKAGLPVTLIGDGGRKQNFIHIQDIANACLLALKNSVNGIYNLTFEKSYSMLELASAIKRIYNSKSDLLFERDKEDTQANVNFNNNKLKNEFSWTPAIDLESGLLKTLST